MTDIDPVDVRLAVPEDREAILRLTTQLHGENGLFTISPAKVEKIIDRYYNRNGAIIGVIGRPGEIAAAIYLGLTQLNYTDDWCLMEEFNFVKPEFRTQTYARQLLSFAKRTADQMKVPLMVGILSNHRTEAKIRLYERVLDKAGAYFVHGLEYVTAPAWKS